MAAEMVANERRGAILTIRSGLDASGKNQRMTRFFNGCQALLVLTAAFVHGVTQGAESPRYTVAPGDVISDLDNNHHDFDFKQLGIRVPAVAISPLIPPNRVDHTLYDHSSWLATVEKLYGFAPLRRAGSRLHRIRAQPAAIEAPQTTSRNSAAAFGALVQNRGELWL